MSTKRPSPRRLGVEKLESRLALSLVSGLEEAAGVLSGDLPGAEGRGDAKGGGGSAPQIRLDLVALHEFGHSLGLDHSFPRSSIMYPYYNATYDLGKFAGDPAVAKLQQLYSNESTRPWKNALDPNPNNGTVEVTYSFMPDGVSVDKGTTTTFATFNGLFGDPTKWEPIFVDQLNRWADNSGGTLAFLAYNRDSSSTNPYNVDTGLPFNYRGQAQNDSRSGDIRIAAHRFDGAGKTLGHTYYPPPNGYTAAGDSHYDQAENWVASGVARLGSSGAQGESGSGSGVNGGGSGARLVFAEWGDADQDAVFAAALNVDRDLADSTESASATHDALHPAHRIDQGNTAARSAPLLVFGSTGSSTTDTTDDAAGSAVSGTEHEAVDRLFASPDMLDLPSSVELHLPGLGRPGWRI